MEQQGFAPPILNEKIVNKHIFMPQVFFFSDFAAESASNMVINNMSNVLTQYVDENKYLNHQH